jgi:hypothetical protein
METVEAFRDQKSFLAMTYSVTPWNLTSRYEFHYGKPQKKAGESVDPFLLHALWSASLKLRRRVSRVDA